MDDELYLTRTGNQLQRDNAALRELLRECRSKIEQALNDPDIERGRGTLEDFACYTLVAALEPDAEPKPEQGEK